MAATAHAVPAPGAPPLLADIKAACVWGALAALATVAVLPYLLQLMPEAMAKIPLPLPLFAALQAMQALVLLGLLSFLGLRMGHRVGLGSPVLQGWLARRSVPWRALRPGQAVMLGVAAALAVIAGALVLDPLLPAPRAPIAGPGAARSALNGLLASFYGGIAEELQLRLFLMTLLVWVVARVRGRMPPAAAYWGALAVAAVLFGAGHLPAAAQVWGLDAIVVARTLLLNAVAGVAFGWLYWRRGLEMAMLAHFSADIVLHVLMPLAGWGSP